jgi:hypothetical protein
MAMRGVKDRKRVRMSLRLDIEIVTIDQLKTRTLRIAVW